MNIYGVNEIIKNALDEDIGTGDITTQSTIAQDILIKGRFIAKEQGVVCGMDIVERVFSLIDDMVVLTKRVNDGDVLNEGTIIADIQGAAQSVLTGERVALNFLQHLSGIATITYNCVKAIKGTKARVCDTRKTTPGLRVLEKYAVKIGGGYNHRYNLSDGVLIKDNHIKSSGGIRQAVENARNSIPHTLKIEVEVENEQMIREALDSGADIIMLDNMSLEEMKTAVELIDGRALIEASGNMGDKDLRAVADTGVDLISIGSLTHSVKALDISLRFE